MDQLWQQSERNACNKKDKLTLFVLNKYNKEAILSSKDPIEIIAVG